MNKIPSPMVRLMCPDPVLFWAYLLPILYWIYLTLTANFVLVFDSEGYFQLAHLFYDPGQWIKYFTTGPNREPFYPLLIAASMHTGKWLGVSYTYPLKVFSFGFLAATMVLIQQVLKVLKANRWIVAGTILYTGFSPVLINAALCLYSEIVSLPWLVAAVLLSLRCLRSLREKDPQDLAMCAGLSACLLGFTFVKGMGEALAPLFLLWLFFYAWRHSRLKMVPFLTQTKSKTLIILFVFFVPLLSYKSVNYIYNGHFYLTNRANLNLYGNLTRRAKIPLTIDNFLSHLATVPVSYDLCSRFYPDARCSQWSMSASDENFLNRMDQLNKQNLSPGQIDKIITQNALQAFISHPWEQLVYFVQDGMKMFFWETSGGPFVVYPPWLEHVFSKILVFTCLGGGCFCLAGFLTACTLLKNETILVTVVLTGILIFLYSFFDIIHRYAITAAPLMILINASCLSLLTSRPNARKGAKTT